VGMSVGLVGLSLSIASRDLCFALLSDTYGILVHSCYISDGQGENVEVVDDRGSFRNYRLSSYRSSLFKTLF